MNHRRPRRNYIGIHVAGAIVAIVGIMSIFNPATNSSTGKPMTITESIIVSCIGLFLIIIYYYDRIFLFPIFDPTVSSDVWSKRVERSKKFRIYTAIFLLLFLSSYLVRLIYYPFTQMFNPGFFYLSVLFSFCFLMYLLFGPKTRQTISDDSEA